MGIRYVPCTSKEHAIACNEAGILVCNNRAKDNPKWVPAADSSAMRFVEAAFSGREVCAYEWQPEDYAYILED